MIGVSTMSGCCVNCQFCFEEGTMITMADFSLKPIENIQIGDKVIGTKLAEKFTPNSQDYTTRYLVPTTVKSIFVHEYNDDIYGLTTATGKTISVTKDHPIACTKNDDSQKSRIKFFKASEINIGDMVYTTKSRTSISNIWRLGWLYGFSKGDGVQCKAAPNKKCEILSLSQSYRNVINFAKDICNEFNISHSNISINENKIVKNTWLTNYRLVINSTGIKTLQMLVNQYKDTDDFKHGALAGFWDAEGSSFKNESLTRMCGCNKELLQSFGEIAKYFGYSYKVVLYDSEIGKDNRQDCYMLETNISRINFICEFNPIHPKSNFFENYTRKIKGVYKEKIISIKRRKVKTKVYNFETKSHTYIANNIIVHNCSTGNMKKFRNLTAQEIVEQVEFILSLHKENPLDSKEFKINYTRMGEPFLNIKNVKEAISISDKYKPHHYISTIGIKNSDFSFIKDNITLQISLHSLDDKRRNELIPFKNKMTIEELGQIRTKSNLKTTINMTLVDNADFDIDKLKEYFDPKYFFIKLSPINENAISKKNHLGKGIVEGINII
jgi:23S rRNA (adenine2503-C2)-methyltransferase